MERENEENRKIPLLTFNSLYVISREEKKAKNLQPLPKAFTISLQNFLETKRGELQKFKDRKSVEEFKKTKKTLTNSKKILMEIFLLRLSKISNIAIRNSYHKSEVIKEENILEEELFFFNTTKDESEKFFKKIVN